MGDLQLSADSRRLSLPHAGAGSRIARFGRALRSGTFFVIYICYLAIVVGLGQRLVLWPLAVIFPRRRPAMIRSWMRLHGRITFVMTRWLANVRLTVRGTLPPESCVVVMNHQSVFDIPLAVRLTPGPYPIIPTRIRYKYGLPGISPLGRLAGFPYLVQGRVLKRTELAALTEAAALVARGERTLVIFPEGHRTRDGRIGRFMRSGLRILLPRARRPVYCVVADGMADVRTIADMLFRFADTHIRAVVLGPFPPPDEGTVEPFIDMLQERMTAALEELRSSPSPVPAAAKDPGVAHSDVAR